MTSAADLALKAVERSLPDHRPIALHEPTFSGREWEYVKDCLDSGWVSSAGSYVDRFEREIAAYCGVEYAVAIVNGTAALHACLMVADVRIGDEVIVPALTFVATANAVAYCGAVPHFADIERATLGIDPDKLRQHLAGLASASAEGCINKLTGRRIRALIVMHSFGLPSRMSDIRRVCDDYGLVLIEDAAEALGSRIGNAHVGGGGVMASLSFNGNKTITTGGGGALLTRDSAFAKRAKHLTTTARIATGWEFDHDEVGYNYRLPNINAALGCAQLEALPDLLAAKRRIALRYQAAFQGIGGVQFVAEPAGTHSNYWLCTLAFDHAQQRDLFLKESNARNIQTRPPWKAMHRLPMYAACPRMDLSATEDLIPRLVNIPSSSSLA